MAGVLSADELRAVEAVGVGWCSEALFARLCATARVAVAERDALRGALAAAGREADALAQVRAALIRSDSLLSLLRYRCEQTIPWGSLGICTKEHVDEVIGQARAALSVAAAGAK